MTELKLSEIKKVELNILRYFKLFCEENNITYYLSNGTLLGAVKYKGFIPWDDDIDVFVPRNDYDRLVQIFNDNETYKLFSYERNKKFYLPFAKLCDMTTCKQEADKIQFLPLGVDIDIFPLDAWEEDKAKAIKEAKSIKKIAIMLGYAKLNKLQSKSLIKGIVKSIVVRICKIFRCSFFLKKIINNAKKYNGVYNTYLGCKVWPIYLEREIISSSVFSKTVEVEFENEKFAAPIGYHEYLSSLYGDYIQDPPIEKQCSHHNYKAYRL